MTLLFLAMALALEGVRELDEELTVDLFEAILRGQHAVVAIADEHDRLPVQLVREQHLSADRAGRGHGREGVKARITVRVDVLSGATKRIGET